MNFNQAPSTGTESKESTLEDKIKTIDNQIEEAHMTFDDALVAKLQAEKVGLESQGNSPVVNQEENPGSALLAAKKDPSTSPEELAKLDETASAKFDVVPKVLAKITVETPASSALVVEPVSVGKLAEVEPEKESSKLFAKLKEVQKTEQALRDAFYSPEGEYAKKHNEMVDLQKKFNAIDYNAEPKIIDGQTIKPSREAFIIEQQINILRRDLIVLEKDFYAKTVSLLDESLNLDDQAREAYVVEFEKSYDNPMKSDGSTPIDYSGFLARMPREGRDDGYSGRDMVLLHAKEIVDSSLKNEEKLDLLNQISRRVQSGVLGNQASDLLKLYRKRLTETKE